MIDTLVNSADSAVAACLVLAALLYRSRDSKVCLMVFVAFHAVFYLSDTGFQVHITMAAVNALSVMVLSLRVGKVMLGYAVFQYIMAIDAYIYPQTTTNLWHVYPYAAFALNLLVLGSLSKGNGIDAIKTDRFFGFLRRWPATIMRMDKH